MAASFPGWFHGPLTRGEADSRLKGEPPGTFLVRSSPRQSGFVLSMVTPTATVHYQIKQCLDNRAREYLTFETEKSVGPKFQSLAAVMHFILTTPEILSCPLGAWVVGPDAPDYLEPPSLIGVLSDVLTLAGGEYSSVADMVREARRNPQVLDLAPTLAVVGAESVLGVNLSTGASVAVKPGMTLTLAATETDENQAQFVVCEMEGGAMVRFPIDSPMALLPTNTHGRVPTVGGGGDHAAPLKTTARSSHAVDRRASASMGSMKAMASDPLKKYSATLKPEETLQSLFKQHGGLKLQGRSEHGQVFYRDVIKEGWLSKLPPIGNTFAGWKRRWFRLAVVLSTDLGTGPVQLEYYTKPSALVPKGVINLCNAVGVSRADQTDSHWKRFKDTPHALLFKVSTPARVYPILANSDADLTSWTAALTEAAGLTDDGEYLSEVVTLGPVKGDRAVEQEFLGCLMNREYENRDVMLFVKATSIVLQCPVTDAVLGTLDVRTMKCYGFVKHVFWVELVDDKAFGSGIFCFACIHALAAYEALCHNAMVAAGASKHIVRRFSRRQQMSWSSLDGVQGTEAAGAVVRLFGLTLAARDLDEVGVAVSKGSFRASDPRETSLEDGEMLPVFRSRAFLGEGFWVVRRGTEYRLVRDGCVKLHDHNLNPMDEEKSSGSIDSLLADTDQTIFVKSPAGVPRGGLLYEANEYVAEEPPPHAMLLATGYQSVLSAATRATAATAATAAANKQPDVIYAAVNKTRPEKSVSSGAARVELPTYINSSVAGKHGELYVNSHVHGRPAPAGTAAAVSVAVPVQLPRMGPTPCSSVAYVNVDHKGRPEIEDAPGEEVLGFGDDDDEDDDEEEEVAGDDNFDATEPPRLPSRMQRSSAHRVSTHI